jgi:glycerol kinase
MLMPKKFILALDQGTTSCRAILFDIDARIVGMCQKEITQIYPKPGWVEHDPIEIFNTQIEVAGNLLSEKNISPAYIETIGLTNQRETTILWDKRDGKPVYNAIVWQDTRTNEACKHLKNSDKNTYINEVTGLVIDSYFSATKIKWILENIPGVREESIKGNILFGTIDSWLLWKLTGGKSHNTDYSNASRTMLFNIHELKWDKKILELLDIPEQILPEVKPSSSDFGLTSAEIFGSQIPITGIAGDQQAALFGHACFEKGMLKNTYGTGCFMLMNTGYTAIRSKHGLLTTIAWGIDDKVEYALEGSVFIAGAAVQWLRDNMKIIKHASETDAIASSINDTKGVYFVPAFTGLGTPYWDMNACGALIGLRRDTAFAEITRAVLESIAYQTKDVIESMREDSCMEIKILKVDGGAVANEFLMQFQCDILNLPVERPDIIESTAQGAAFLAGIYTGFWTKDQIRNLKNDKKIFQPDMTESIRNNLYNGWKKAVGRVMNWHEV